MKASMYFNYTSRSLLRGGQRTVLAVFCVAVGVMAIVSLQLAGNMLSNSLTSNTRDANGGDIAVTASVPLKQSDLSYFTRLEEQRHHYQLHCRHHSKWLIESRRLVVTGIQRQCR